MGTLPKDEVERMVKDAEENAAADKEKTEQIEIVNQAEALCYQTKKQLEQVDSTIAPEEKQKIQTLVEELESTIKSENFDKIKDLTETLKKAVMELGEKAYSSSSNQNSSNEDVIDTDFSAEKK